MRKINKIFDQQKVFNSVFGGVQLTPLSTLKNFFLQNVLLIFIHAHEKYIFFLKDFLHNSLLILFDNVLC